MKTIGLFVGGLMLLSNTFNIRTNARILTSNVLDSASTVIHPHRGNF